MPDHKSDQPLPESALATLGFTELESRVYCELLRQGSASGYRLSQIIGKAPANTYQALATLTQKGAVVVSDDISDKKTFTPLRPGQLIGILRKSYDERAGAALTSLEEVDRPKAAEERVYSIGSVVQVIERARDMLARAEEIILFDFFPQVYDLLRREVDEARARGVTVAGIAYDKRDAGPGMPFNKESIDLVGARWPGLGLILIVDGSEYLIAQLSRSMQDVLNAVWTDSVFLSCVFHSAVAADIRLVALRADETDPLRGLSLQGATPPGLRRLLQSERGSD